MTSLSIRLVSGPVTRAALCFAMGALPLLAQQATPGAGLDIYQALKRFELSDGTAVAENLTLKRDRLEMTFNGTFYFEPPVADRVRGAVFLGRGTFRAEVPPSAFERDHVRRMLKADVVESDFQTAVLRFTDDTFDQIGKTQSPAGKATPEAQQLATKFGPRLLKETGANIPARLAISILNQETPGVFVGQFDKGKRDRFTVLLDYQGRIPTATFEINGGEKGLIFANRSEIGGNDIWMAFYSAEDYQRGQVQYSDAFDLVAVQRYTMAVDVRDPTKVLKLQTRMDMEAVVNGLRAIPLSLGESLPEYDSLRLKKTMRLKSVRFADGVPLDAIQEDWEGGLTLFLPTLRAAGEKFSVLMELEGDYMYDSPYIPECYYPRGTGEWYPRHGYLNRSTFDLTFHHRKQYRVAASGVRVREERAPGSDSEMITEWKMDRPVALVTFGIGRFERHAETVKRKEGDLPVEFYSLPGSILAIKEDFIVAELMNCMQYFSALFGPYPYSKFGAVYHPRGFGQGFASLLLLPKSDRASKYTYSFIAHETAHQWWGNIVAWRSYRDQWLSEGFAEYSGILYTGLRDKPGARKELIDDLRRSLKDPPATDVGIGKGRLADVGPIILGHRLSTRETLGAYSALIYNKGALVLRMLHFLFTDPATGDGQPFFDMMSDFVRRHENGWATTDSFREVANEHFARSPIARKYGLKDLNWFFRQWVYQAHLPSYRLQYQLEGQPDGSVVVKGTVYQDNAPEDWFTPLPLVMRFGKDRVARGSVHALGPNTPFMLKVPARPDDVQLDPEEWVLSEKTSTKALK